MYNFREIANKNEWESFLEKYPTTPSGVSPVTFIQSWNWGEFQQELGRNIYRLGIYSESNELVGIAQGVVINAKRGKYLYIRNGPVMDWSDAELVQQTVSHLKKWSSEKKLWFIRMSPLVELNSKGDVNISTLKLPLFQMNDVEALNTWILDLKDTDEGIFSKIDKKDRYYIRKATKSEPEGYGLQPFITSEPQYFDDFYKIYIDTVKRQKWSPYSYNYLKNEYLTFAKDKQASLVMMKCKGMFIAGGVFIHYGNQSFYHYGGYLTEYSKMSPSYAVLWEAIKLSKQLGKSHFNFWGIAPENRPKHPWSGLSQFKKKFPGFEQKWTPARDIPNSPLYWLTHLYDKIDRIQKGY